MKLYEIEGIGEVYARKLEQSGIRTPSSLLEKGKTAAQRRKLAQETGIDENLILQFVMYADLLRLEGIGLYYADLLEEVGVDTSEELAVQDVKNLAEQMQRVNEQKKIVRRLPGRNQLTRAIQSAIAINQSPRGLAGDSTTDAPPPKKKYGPKVEY